MKNQTYSLIQQKIKQSLSTLSIGLKYTQFSLLNCFLCNKKEENDLHINIQFNAALTYYVVLT